MPAFRSLPIAALVLLTLLLATPALAQPGFSKVFQPSSIGPGGHSQLVFTITNGSGVPVINMAFDDTLPAAISFATPPSASTDCGNGIVGIVGSTLSLTDGEVPAFGSCTVVVDVVSNMPGTHTNTSTDLTSSAGNSGTATDDLEVTASKPSFSKSFSPASIGFGGRSTLTFSLDNSANASNAFSAAFIDNLPTGLVIADPANASTDCLGATLNTTAGGSQIEFFGGALLAGATCTVTVDIEGDGVGTFVNRSDTMFSAPIGPSQPNGFAVAALDVVSSGEIAARKAFLGDPVNAGDTVELEFTLTNRDRSDAATDIAFTDDLDAVLSGLVATGLPASNVCGAGSMLTGTSTLTLTGGNLPREGTCTFSVTLQVPAAAAAGAYPNTTSTISAMIGGSPATGDPATETLFVTDAPRITKTFLTDPVGAGDTTQLEFTITNVSSTSSATNITVEDNLSAFLSGTMITGVAPTPPCGAGSVVTPVVNNGDTFLALFSGNLAPSASCTFTVDLLIPANAPAATYTNTTEPITATVDGITQMGGTATDTLAVVGAPRLTKTFTDDPVAPGGTVTLEFTLEHDAFAATDATDITFTDNLSLVLAGLTATGLPLNNICGTGSSISGTTNLTFAGGTLTPGDTCTFSVTLDVPPGALPGQYTNTTSDVTATVSGVTSTASGSSDILTVAGLEFTKEFIDDPLLPGGTGTLRFTINNTSTIDLSGMLFTDNLPTALTGLTAIGVLPTDPCGAGSMLSGTTFLIFSNGSLTAGTSCTFDVTVQVPGGAANGSYINSTSDLIVGTPSFSVPPAADALVVDDEVLAVTKEFTNDPVAAGGVATMELTITNTSLTETITGIALTDDLDAMLTGATAVGLPQSNVCGAGSMISGTGLITLTGASLTPGASCALTIAVQVPAAAADGSYVNTTSIPSGTSSVGSVSGNAAMDALVVRSLVFAKAFLSDPLPGDTVDLQFSITNPGSTAANLLSFSDDLDAVLSGLVATGLPMTNVCGAGSTISGTSTLSFTNGSLAAGTSCLITVTLQVPLAATAGAYPNTTSALFSSGLPAADPATDTLDVLAPTSVDVTIAQSFSSTPVLRGQTVDVSYTILNNSPFPVSGMTFTENFGAALTGLVATGLPQSNVCGTGSMLTGTSTLSFTGGSLAPSSQCTLTVTLQVPNAAAAGTVNGAPSNLDITVAGAPFSITPTTDTFDVALLTFSKSFQTNPVLPGDTVDLMFSISNPDPVHDAVALTFTDDLDATLTGLVATGLPMSNVCGAGSSLSGTSTLTLSSATVAAGGSCDFTVTLQVPLTATVGTYPNATSDLTSSGVTLGDPAMDDLEVIAPATVDVTLVKRFQWTPVLRGQSVIVEFDLDNNSALEASAIAFSTDFDAALSGTTIASLPMTTSCPGATLGGAGTGILTFSGGTLAGGASCGFAITIQLPDTAPAGTVNCTTSTLDFTAAGAPYSNAAASDSFDVTLLDFTKTITGDPVMPGDTFDMTFSITNPDPNNSISSLTFTDDLDTLLPGLAAVGTPVNDVCGSGSMLSGTGLLTLTDGTLAGLGFCEFTVTVQVPLDAAAGMYTNTTSDLTSGVVVVGDPASDDFEVMAPSSVDVIFTKVFDSTPVLLGGDVGLEYTITNNAAVPITTIAFDDDLDAAIPGSAAVGLPTPDICGVGSTISGTNQVSFTGGSLAPMSSCTFTITVRMPTALATLGNYTSNSTNLSFLAAGQPFSAARATASVDVVALEFTKSFDAASVRPGDVVGLTFSITNPDPVNAATSIGFTDDLDAVAPGLVATGTPLPDVCGLGSSLTGTSTITLADGELAGGASCTFSVDVVIPDVSSGTYVNVTSALSSEVGGASVPGDPADAAIASLVIANLIIEVPTLGTWGLIAMAALLALFAVGRMRLD